MPRSRHSSGFDAGGTDLATRPPDLRLVPVAIAAWAGMWAATAGGSGWLLVVGVTAAIAVAVAAGRRRRSWAAAAVAVVLLGCLGTGWAREWWRANDPLVRLADQQAVGIAELTVVGTPRGGERTGVRPAWWSSAARLDGLDARGERLRSGAPVQISASGDAVSGWATVVPGSRVRVTVRLAPAEPGDSVFVWVRAREPPVVVAPAAGTDAAIERVRAGLRQSAAHLDPEPRALVPALVVGDTSGMPSDLVDRFKVVGLTHLTAVSGANLTLLLAFLGTLARWCGVTGWWFRGLLGLGVVGFVLLCHAEPSVVRAAAMGVVGLVALGAGGSGGRAVRALCVAVVVIVLVDPVMARSAGFALSVLASAGIVAWSRAWTDALARRLPRGLAEGLATPLAAQLATQPLVTLLSGQVSLVGLVANLAAGPLVGPATVLGFLAAAFAVPLGPVAALFATGAGWCAQSLCWIARLGELFPAAAVPWPATVLGVGLVLAGCVGLVLVMPRLLHRGWPAAVAGLLLIVALLRPPSPPGWPPPDWSVVFCDVGQGDATLLRVGPRAAALVDAGPDPSRLRACLDGLGVESVPLVVLTHFHADHITGITTALDGRHTTTVAVSAATSPAGGRALVEQAASGIGLTTVGPGSGLRVGELSIEVLATRPTTVTAGAGVDEGESSAENDGSLVMRARVGGLRVLLPGDVQEDGQRAALATGADLSADVLLVPHHGSGRQLPEFLAASRAAVAVFSVGLDNDYGHPAVRTQRAVQGLGMQLARTDQHGSIAVSGSPGALVLTTQR